VSVSLSIAIMAHPKREARIPALRSALPEHARVVYDPEPDGKPETWRTARVAWWDFMVAPREPSHHLVLQDDVILCEFFVHGIIRAIEARPDHALSFYANKMEVGQALLRGDSWVYHKGPWYNAQAVVLPVGWIPGFVAFGDAMEGEGDDWRLREYLHAIGARMLLSAPCLVQHDAPESSLLGHGAMPNRRVTNYFADDLKINVMDIDWTKGDGSE
jgi:hypothetical protein